MIGVDIAVIERFERVVVDSRIRWRFAFSTDEWIRCMSSTYPAQSFAGVFALKEAVMKSIGGDLVGAFHRIEIRRPSIRPEVYIDGTKRSGLSVSLSHDGGFVVAVAHAI